MHLNTNWTIGNKSQKQRVVFVIFVCEQKGMGGMYVQTFF